MNAKSAMKLTALVAAGAVLAAGGYWLGTQGHETKASIQPEGSAAMAGTEGMIDPKTGRKVLYWHDPMVPGQRFHKPGKSPFMDMQLVPVYADVGPSEGGVKISPALQQNLGIRFAIVRREEIKESFEMVGTTQFDESGAEVVQSRVNGYIDRLYTRAPMQRVKRGDPIALLFVPEWVAPQEEYLVLRRAGNESLAAASRERMRVLSIPEGLIAKTERTGKAQKHLTLTSPVNGVITELAVRDGAMVSPGMTVAKVASLSTVWLVADIPEALANSVRSGMTVEATFSGNPSRKYKGQVREILPGVNASTRTLQARLQLDNQDGSLTPGMLMRVRLGSEKATSRLLVPSEAVITSGKRTMVVVAGENNSMQPVAVTTGRDTGNDTEILSGLAEGQKVVASGQFLIDSEASLKGVLPRFSDDKSHQSGQPSRPAAGPLFHGIGKIEKISPDAFTISHKPIPELKWGAMTMDFNVPKADAFAGVKAGQDIEFSFRETKDGYLLEHVTPIAGDRK